MPEPYVALAKSEADRLGVNDGAMLALRVKGQALRLPLHGIQQTCSALAGRRTQQMARV